VTIVSTSTKLHSTHSVLADTFIEVTVVGMAQWLVLHHPFPAIRWRAWVVATAVGVIRSVVAVRVVGP
jgi:hypothetical protein